MIVTVTLNAALDRSLTVPILQVGHRHRASEVRHARRWQGRQRGAGAQAARRARWSRPGSRAAAPGRASWRSSPTEAILNDFVRIREESRTSTIVLDPTSGTHTEIHEWGPRVTPSELGMLMDKLRYLSRGADSVVFAGSLPRGVDEGFYADAARELTRRAVHVVLDTEGEPLRRGLEAEPWLVSPNQHEAEQLVGQELSDDEDFLWALDAIAEMGARNVQITMESGCYVLVREERTVRRYRAVAPQLEPVSAVGAGRCAPRAVARRAFRRCRRGGRAPAGRRRRRGVGARGRRRPLRPGGGEAPHRGGRGARAAGCCLAQRRIRSRGRGARKP